MHTMNPSQRKAQAYRTRAASTDTTFTHWKPTQRDFSSPTVPFFRSAWTKIPRESPIMIRPIQKNMNPEPGSFNVPSSRSYPWYEIKAPTASQKRELVRSLLFTFSSTPGLRR